MGEHVSRRSTSEQDQGLGLPGLTGKPGMVDKRFSAGALDEKC